MFDIGDIVYPFFSRNLVNWGTVVDINPVTRKVTVNFNGIERQFDPEWIIKTNPEIKVSSKKRVAQEYHKMVQALYYKEAPSILKMSQEQEQTGQMYCPKCHQKLVCEFDIQNSCASFVCKKCGKKIARNKIASRMNDLALSIQQFVRKRKGKTMKKQQVLKQFVSLNPEYKNDAKYWIEDIIEQLKNNNTKII